MKTHIPRILLSFLVTMTLATTGQSQNKRVASKKSAPNIIIILTDDMGYGDVGFGDHRYVSTPHIDKLAASGLRLTQYYAAAPICSPSRAGLLTGMYPGRWNFTTYLDNKKHNKDAEQTDYLNPKAPTIAWFFKNSGYATGHFGKWHMGGGRDVTNAPKFKEYGFDAHVSTYESPQPDRAITSTNWIWADMDSVKRWDRTGFFVDKTLAFLKEHKSQPCFINLWPDDVHTPWVPDAEHLSDGKPLKAQEEDTFKSVLKAYDVQIGRLIQGLKSIGADKNTIIIFTSDNGPAPRFDGRRTAGLRGAKASLYEGGIRMPFIISWPGHIAPGTKDSSSVVTAVDLLPSLCKIAGIKTPSSYTTDGMDRSSVLLGKPASRKKPVFWEYGRNDIAYAYPKAPDRSPRLAVRSGDWKLLCDPDGHNPELYNIVKDPRETTNLQLQEKAIEKQLSALLLNWWNSLPKLSQ